MLYYKVGVDFDRVGDVICHNTKKGNIEIMKYCRAQEEEPMDKDFELLFDKKEGNVLTDLLANDNGWFLVSERFREIILEQFNTNVQFFDVKIKEVQSRSILEKYYIANILPSYWHAFANVVARLCQCDGTTLPIRWHNFANAMAKDGRRRA